ncbi:hypothetical protein XCR_2915 [Xanthomonas campestris pv. raphani 756C]|jgi:hypothetical protein|nr:hypothetical protein XCR_2915 [Xanthomonas campestris pv. raphani 756C]
MENPAAIRGARIISRIGDAKGEEDVATRRPQASAVQDAGPVPPLA